MTWHIVPVYYDTETKLWAAGDEPEQVLNLNHSLIYDPKTDEWVDEHDASLADAEIYGILTAALDRLNQQED